jgi:hypothetical protein
MTRALSIGVVLIVAACGLLTRCGAADCVENAPAGSQDVGLHCLVLGRP